MAMASPVDDHFTRASSGGMGSVSSSPMANQVLHPAKLLLDQNIMRRLSLSMCPICGNDCVEAGIDCHVCHQRFHLGCVKMSVTTYKAIQKQPQLKWFCTACTDVSVRGKPTGPGVDQQNAVMMEMMDRMTKMMDRIDRMEEKIVTRDTLKDFEKYVEDMVDSKIEDKMEERLEKEKRKLNLIFVNVKESVGKREERLQSDIEKVRSIVGEILPEDEAKEIRIKNPVRLGGENAGNRPRLLRIEVQTEEMKYKILKNASKLNEGKDWSDPTRRYVNMDYTAKERQINKELREQLKALKVSEPHKRHMIKGGKIVSEVVKKD